MYRSAVYILLTLNLVAFLELEMIKHFANTQSCGFPRTRNDKTFCHHIAYALSLFYLILISMNILCSTIIQSLPKP